jgi:hypothetical protein
MWGSRACEILRVRSYGGQRFFAAIGLGMGLVCYGAPDATAQVAPEYQYVPDMFQDEIPRGETVRSRQRPEVAPLGVHAGSFFLFPSITNGLSFTDNVFAAESHKKSDFLYTLAPQINVRSDWNQNSVELAAGGRLGFYFDQTGENYKDAFASAAGKLDVSSSTVLHGKLGIQRDHEERGDPNEVNGSEPTVFYTYAGTVDGSHRFNRLTLSAGGDVRRIQYDDTAAVGNTTIDNSDRNRVEYRPGVKAAYEFSPGYSGYVRAEGDIRQYDKTFDSDGFKRDSKGFDVVGGASVDLTGLLFGDFFAGIRQRYFDDARFDSITGPVVGSTLTWIPTGLTTVKLKIDNQVIESTGINTSGYTSTGAGLSVDHELLRNLILSAGLGARYDDFEGISRTDKFFYGTLGADYLMNRYLTLGGRYTFSNRDSNTANADYTSNLFALMLTAQL